MEKRPDVVEVRKMFGFREHPDGDSVLVTNDTIAEIWPRIPEERQAELLAGPDPFVIVTWTEPPTEEPSEGQPDGDSAESAPARRRRPTPAPSQE